MLNKDELPTVDKLMKHATTSKLTIAGKKWITSVISHVFLSCPYPAVNTFWRQYSGVPGRILKFLPDRLKYCTSINNVFLIISISGTCKHGSKDKILYSVNVIIKKINKENFTGDTG